MTLDAGGNGQMRQSPQSARARWCVFTSAGDYSNVLSWLPPNGGARDWDLVVAFYGDSDDEFRRLSGVADVIFRRKGGKFQNLRHFHVANPGLLQRYDYVFVCDDDLIWAHPADIGGMFRFTAAHELWVSQPAFSSIGRISFRVTRWAGLHSSFRHTNFVEMTCPLFRTHALLMFLDVFDGRLVGWGADWWYCNVLQSRRHLKFAINDEIVVINPRPNQRRGGRREITSLLGDAQRRAQWHEVMQRYRLEEFRPATLTQRHCNFRYNPGPLLSEQIADGNLIVRLPPPNTAASAPRSHAGVAR